MHRIQRKRSKGGTMPPSSVYIGRPSKFGNPDEIRKPIPKDPVTLNGIKYISEEVISNALTDEKKVYLRQYLENQINLTKYLAKVLHMYLMEEVLIRDPNFLAGLIQELQQYQIIAC